MSDFGAIASKVHPALRTPLICANHVLLISTGIGIAIYEAGEVTPDELLKRADGTMYEAKKSLTVEFAQTS